MRLSLRFVIPLLAALGIFAYAALPLVDKLMLRWFGRDLEVRASLIANTVDDPLQNLIRSGNQSRVLAFFTRITQDERLLALAFCPADTGEVVATPMLPAEVQCSNLGRFATPAGELLQTGTGPVFVSVRQLPGGQLVLVHDMSWFARRSRETRQYFFLFFVGLGLTVAFITVVIAQLSWRGWVQGLRGLLRGEGLVAIPGRSGGRSFSGPPPELRPIAKDLRALIEELEADHRSRDDEQLVWTPGTLRQILRRELRGKEIIVVSNREPYIHVRRGGEIEVWRPASGLVTALEPIMRACSGTWIAHGSGDADRETVDARDRVAVPPPPDDAAYQLRRVWLTREEEAGYYYGFANEGIWPLCHIAHVRPVFRRADWEQYVAVNRKFARTVIEVAQSADPIVLVQDYHFALLPRMIKEVLLSATIISFWHIPWPNPEAFAICPWREELLDGLLGSTILGFHRRASTARSSPSPISANRPRSGAIRSPSNGRPRPNCSPLRSSSAAPTSGGATAFRPSMRWASASSAWTTRRASRSGFARSSTCSRSSPNGSASFRSSRSRPPRASRSRNTRRTKRACAISRRASISAFPPRRTPRLS